MHPGQPLNPDEAPAAPPRALRPLWVGAYVIAVFMVTVPFAAVILQLAVGHWPGEDDPFGALDDLSSGTIWRTRAVELLGLGLLLVIGAGVARYAFARLRPRIFHSFVLVAAGLAVALPGALVVTNTANAAVADHLDDAWQKQASLTPAVPPPPAPSQALSKVLWHPAHPTPFDHASAVSPTNCALQYGATDGARQTGIEKGIVIFEGVLAFSDNGHATAYMSDSKNYCQSVEDTRTVRSLPRIKQADAQSAWISTSPGFPPSANIRMRFGSIVVTGHLLAAGSTVTSEPVTSSQILAAATLLASAAKQ